MIIHASIPADHPERVARVIAELWQGKAIAFPPIERTWIAMAPDGAGVDIEVSPRDLAFMPGESAVEALPGQATPRHCSSHLFIASALSAEAIIAIGEREGWTTRSCHRGGPGAMGFDLIEMWVENAFMLEIGTEDCVAQYRQFWSGPGRTMFGLKQAA